jgi:hypothetical protein
MNKEEIVERIKKTTGCAAGNLGKYFYKNKQDLDIVIALTNFLPTETSLIDRFYYIRNNLYEIKKCKYCNNVLTKNLKTIFCSSKCNINYQNENTDIIDRRSISASNTYKNKTEDAKKSTKQKRKETNLKKYGVTNNMHIPEIENAIKKTWLENLGVDNPSKSEIVKEKRKETNLKRYNSISPLQGEKQKIKKKETWIKNLGVDNPGKSKKCQEQAKDTYFKKTGFETPMQNPDVINKFRNTFFENEGKGKHKKGYKYKIYNFISGRQILIQGYESGALDNYLLNIYNESEIENNIKIINEFKFEYGITKSGIKRRYIPDFYIKKDNLFIEIKSLYFYNKNLEGVYLKAKSVIEKGYNFYILASNDNKKFKKITYEEIETDFKNRS